MGLHGGGERPQQHRQRDNYQRHQVRRVLPRPELTPATGRAYESVLVVE